MVPGHHRRSEFEMPRRQQTLQDNSPFSLSLSLHSTLNRISSSPFPLYIRFSTLFIFLSTVLVEYIKFSFFFSPRDVYITHPSRAAAFPFIRLSSFSSFRHFENLKKSFVVHVSLLWEKTNKCIGKTFLII